MTNQEKIGNLLYEQSREIAEYYGFISLTDTLASLTDIKSKEPPKLRQPKEGVPGEANRITLMDAYVNHGLSALPQPILIYHSEPLWKQMERAEYGGANAVQFSLEIIGTTKSIAEAILFKTAFTILEEAGFKNMSVVVNSLGDRDSIARFSREFGAYYRKRMSEVPGHCRELIKKDVLKALECATEKCMLFKEEAPKPIASLSEESRRHFSEVLEFLESMSVPYRINHCLVGGKDFYTKTIFEIHSDDESNAEYPKRKLEKVLAKGGRYDDLPRQMMGKREIPAVGISISMGGLGLTLPKRNAPKKNKQATAYLIQLGFDAKLKSLDAIEILRRAHIPIYQSLSKDRFSAQLAMTEKLDIPYMIIIGQREALEGTAIVRNMTTRCQETILLSELPRRLKKV